MVIRVLVARYPVPGWSRIGNPTTHHPTKVKLKSGESVEINFTFYSRESPPGIAKLYSKEQIPMPEGPKH